MPSFEVLLTIAVLAAMTFALVWEAARAELIVFLSLMAFVVSGILSPAEAFRGFSNEGMLSVGFLYVVAAGLESTGILNTLGTTFLGRASRSLSLTLARFLAPVAVTSAFLNNTPLVAMLLPVVKKWTRRTGISPSKVFLPLSYAAILGGTWTIMGTSTNLVVHGLLVEKGLAGFSFFELARVGVPCTVVGLAFIIISADRWLPARKQPKSEWGRESREFVVAMKVNRRFKGIGSTVASAGLRHLQGLFLFQIERGSQTFAPVQPTETILVNDRLFFTGLPATIVELQKQPGLDVIKDAEYDLKNYDSEKINSFEVVVSQASPLIGQTVRESNFRSQYNAVILAIHRSGERIRKKIGDVKLRPGDTLLILAPKDFHERWYHSRDFYLVSTSEQVPSKPRWRAILALGIVCMMVVAVTVNWVPMVVAAAVAAAALVVSGCIGMNDALQSVHWGTLLVIASGLGIAKALEKSGTADLFAEEIAHWTSGYGLLLTIALVYFSTVAYTEFVTNNAAAALMFPIAVATGLKSSIEIMPLVYAVTFGASFGFAMPIGYQTHLMVYGPGGYRLRDYLKIGIPMDLVVGITAVVSIFLVFS